MNLLAVDTTGEALSIALRAGERVFAVHRKLQAPHDETLLSRVESLLARARLKLEDLDAVAAAAGPGRFTGIRIGMAYAAIVAARLKIPVLALSRLEAAAFKTPGRLVCASLPGYRQERLYQLFRRRGRVPRPAGKPSWSSPQEWPLVRAALETQGAVVFEGETVAADLLEPAAFYLGRGRAPKFEPLYLKPAGYERDKARPIR